jgi:hypothetical protein
MQVAVGCEVKVDVDELVREIAGWNGVDVDASRSGMIQVRFGGLELGHVHNGVAAHLPFPRKVRDDLIALGHATPHPLFPSSGWIERRIDADEDLVTVRLLFRVNYERVIARRIVAARRECIAFREPALALASPNS